MKNINWDHVTKNFIAALTVLGFFMIVGGLLFVSPELPEGIKDMVLILLGAVVALTKDVYGFFFGSSRSSDDKDRVIANGRNPD